MTNRPPARSKGVSEAVLAAAAEAPHDATLDFERLYRASRDDACRRTRTRALA